MIFNVLCGKSRLQSQFLFTRLLNVMELDFGNVDESNLLLGVQKGCVGTVHFKGRML